MTLFDLTLPMPITDCKGLALVYGQDVAAALYDLQQSHGDWRHVCYGRPLVDGRWMIDGEILSMVAEGGIYGWVREHMDAETMSQIDIIPLAEAESLLVPPPEPGEA
jgi:hypothetical protein